VPGFFSNTFTYTHTAYDKPGSIAKRMTKKDQSTHKLDKFVTVQPLLTDM